jgi:hypothetical protein
VTLQPGDIITFRAKGTRTSYATSLWACYVMAVKADIAARKAAKLAERKAARRA